MTRPRAALVGFTGIAAGLLLVVWQLPQWLDWTHYRTTIGALASATLGQPVSIRGPISLALLPEPALTPEQARLATLAHTERSEAMDFEAARRENVAALDAVNYEIDRHRPTHAPAFRVPFPTKIKLSHCVTFTSCQPGA